MEYKTPSRRRLRLSIVASMACALVITLLASGLALAHEQRVVGKYRLVVGFVNEPALSSQPNAIDFRVTVSDTQKPVEGLDKTVKVEVQYGGKTLPLTLRARFGQPGAYAADFIPTRAGTYIFHFTGQIEDTKIDEKFESGPGRFNDVEDTTKMQFPEQAPSPLDTAAQLKAAQETASSAQTLAYAGVGLGVIGIILGALGFARRK
ncbi:MAG: hypothetical protein LC737_06585 [Chloroflexi bacterium]|nr:hypothetical protein [Chloroflexota bacterium]